MRKLVCVFKQLFRRHFEICRNFVEVWSTWAEWNRQTHARTTPNRNPTQTETQHNRHKNRQTHLRRAYFPFFTSQKLVALNNSTQIIGWRVAYTRDLFRNSTPPQKDDAMQVDEPKQPETKQPETSTETPTVAMATEQLQELIASLQRKQGNGNSNNNNNTSNKQITVQTTKSEPQVRFDAF